MTGSRSREDDGITLIELIISVSLVAVIAVFVTAFVINAFTTQSTVTDTSENTTEGELVSQLVVKSVRAASAVKVAIGGYRIDMRTQATDGSWVCTAFALDAGGSIRSKTSASAVPSIALAGSVSASASASDAATGWAELSTNVSAIGATPVFSVGTGSTVAYSFHVNGGGTPVSFSGSAVPRVYSGTSAPCF